MKEPKGSKSLLKWLRYGFAQWKCNKDRYSWLWCPLCDNDLNHDNKSFLRESKDHMFWLYKCSRCGCKSKFVLWGPVPLIHSYQKLQSELSEYK